jgi:hypothetical protein
LQNVVVNLFGYVGYMCLSVTIWTPCGVASTGDVKPPIGTSSIPVGVGQAGSGAVTQTIWGSVPVQQGITGRIHQGVSCAAW